jgi:hypothetical protein
MGEFENELQPKIDNHVPFSRGVRRNGCVAIGAPVWPSGWFARRMFGGAGAGGEGRKGCCSDLRVEKWGGGLSRSNDTN